MYMSGKSRKLLRYFIYFSSRAMAVASFTFYENLDFCLGANSLDLYWKWPHSINNPLFSYKYFIQVERAVYLAQNNITKIAPNIFKSTALEYLDLSQNALNEGFVLFASSKMNLNHKCYTEWLEKVSWLFCLVSVREKDN